jgi:hypothetical protein
MRYRNPYVILGLPFGAPREDANIAFAVRAKRLRHRKDAASRTRLTDLTWALNQIDESLKRPDASMDIYRIPADPDLFTSTATGLFSPPPEPLPARPADLPAALEGARINAAHQLLRHLLLLQSRHVGLPNP